MTPTVLLLLACAAIVLAGLAARRAVSSRRSTAQRAAALAAAPAPVDFDRIRRVRQMAEDAALQVALGRDGASRNPFQPRTREAVLWTASFNARLMELETEAFAPAPAVPGLVH